MPFTLSHAAAALPFRKFKPVWPALVIGTFAPDLQYFIWISDEDRSGHHFPQVLLFTLPFALLVLWIFEWIVKGPVIELLPNSLQRRLQDRVEPLSFWGWRRFGSIVFWIAAGITTHVVWDEFTHHYSWLGEHWSLLRTRIVIPFLHPVPLAKILQHASTVLGLVVLCIWFWDWYRRTPAREPRAREFSPLLKAGSVLTMTVIAAVVGYVVAIFRLAAHELPITRLSFIVTVFEAVTLVFCVQILVYGLAKTINARIRGVTTARLDEQGG